jgi:hypothetical protein
MFVRIELHAKNRAMGQVGRKATAEIQRHEAGGLG